MCYPQMLVRIALTWDGLKEEFVPDIAEPLEISGVLRFLVSLAAGSLLCPVIKTENKFSGLGIVQKEPLEVLVSGP